RRGPVWWDAAVRKGSRITVLAFGECVAGYANYGRNRARSLYYDGEVYELYLRPEFQGLGFGRKLFSAARRGLVQSGLTSLVVRAPRHRGEVLGFPGGSGGRAGAGSPEGLGPPPLEKAPSAGTHCPLGLPGPYPFSPAASPPPLLPIIRRLLSERRCAQPGDG